MKADQSKPDGNPAGDSTPHAAWTERYRGELSDEPQTHNRSGLEVRPLYVPSADPVAEMPGEYPYTRGIYTTMYRGRTWTQRQLIGLGTPEDYNTRVHRLLSAGANAISLLPCNSVFRGYDCDEVDLELLGTCGTVVNTAEHMDTCLRGVDLSRISAAMNDPTPFTLLAFMLAVAQRRKVDWSTLTGTSNQSDYISHFVANHMFFRLALPGARRILGDQIRFCLERVPRWNPLSVVGQHMQQAGATPAQAMGFTLSTAIQYAEDCRAAGIDPDAVLPRFTFFFDISISFFEEIAKFRAGRRLWARITRERLGAKNPRSWRFKFHGQTSGADLTRQQPLNNIARVTAQAMAGIFSGLQSMHTDAYDEALVVPREDSARIAIATQNILREEAGLCEVIDPLGGSYYVEQLTDEMEADIAAVIRTIDEAGGMYAAVESGLVQRMIGESALRFQDQIDQGERKIVGVNAFIAPEDGAVPPTERPDPRRMAAHIDAFVRFKRERSAGAVAAAIDEIARSANDPGANIFSAVVEAAAQSVTHGEIVACLRRELGFGHPLVFG